MIPPHSPASFLQEFIKVVRGLPQSNFGGTWRALDDSQKVLLAELDRMIKDQKVSINLNLSDDPKLKAVLDKVQQGLGELPAPYKELVTETVAKALQDNPGARSDFQNLIRYAKASTAVLAEAKAANLSAEDTTKLTNLLQQAQPFEGILGVLIANTFDAAKNLDIKALVNIFRDCEKSLGDIVSEHTPKGLSSDPLQVLTQVQGPMANALPSVAQRVMTDAVDYVGKNALPLSKVFANAFAAFSTVADRLKSIWSPSPTGLSDMLGISKEQAAKASLN
jgi:hypothetical protein